MNKKVSITVAIILLVCFLFVFAISFLSPFMASAATTQQKVDQKTQEKKEIQKKINEKENEKKGVLAQKNDLEEKINSVQKEIDTIQLDIDKYNNQIAEKQSELSVAEEKSKAQFETMKTRLRVMYEDNSTSYITLLFSNEKINDILSYIEIIKQLLNYDNDMYESLLETQNKIEAIKKGLEDDKAQVVSKQNVFVSKKEELDSKKSELTTLVNEINSDIDKEKELLLQAEKEEAALKKQLASELSKTTGKSSVPVKYTGGKFLWPAPGYYTITSEYGYRIHPTLGVYKLHTGIDIAVPSGVGIIAAAGGTVIKAGYNSAYGNMVVVDHGGGYSTLYAHNTSLLVSAGQSVSAGQTIAYSGSTGYSTGPHCHFEVMINGNTTNPRNYF